MTHYIDSSALVAALVPEQHTPRIRAWLPNCPPGNIFISDWTHTEIASALSLKVRTKQLTLEQRAEALSTWNRLHIASLNTLAILPEHFEAATRIATQYDLGIRSGDALHLAVTVAVGLKLVTLDKAMAAAAPVLGIPIEHI